jgi:hypothetical protein
MKARKISKKLSIKKETVANLIPLEQQVALGGKTATSIPGGCDTYCESLCTMCYKTCYCP